MKLKFIFQSLLIAAAITGQSGYAENHVTAAEDAYHSKESMSDLLRGSR
jgi:hypothetical protein